MALVALAALIVVSLPTSAARADFTSDTVISGTAAVQSDYAYDPAVSANGQYVAFTGSQAGAPGVYRKNLQTGELDLVAAGDAGAPSISADGQFVSFTTTATDPASGTGQQCSSVYVRDMSQPIDAPGAFTLASALSGVATGLTYAGTGTAGCPGGGSSAAAGVALSGDGSEVAFTVVGASNLATGADGAPTTPPAQVAVRNLDTDATTLVSQTMASLGSTAEPVPGGAAMTDTSTDGGANADAGDSTASISADGTTVAWLGINIPSQAPAATQDAAFQYPDEYDEPLWRRIADGPSAPTRRVLGGDDPVGPCPGGCTGPLDLQWPGESPPGSNTGPERGSLIAYNGFLGATDETVSTLANGIPKLSADGNTVAVLSTAPLTGQVPACTGPSCSPNVAANAYVVNMAPGLSRGQALTQLTEWASYNFTAGAADATGALTGIAISPEGDEVAFVTQRTEFPLSPPLLTTPALTSVGNPQLYVVDLDDGTMQLASLGFDGQPANDPIESPSFSDDGGPIAFASPATNLVYGAESDLYDGSQLAGAEVFTTTELQPSFAPGVTSISALPTGRTITPEWVISASATKNRDGSVSLAVRVPGAGAVRAVARSGVTKPARGKHAGRATSPSSLARAAKRATGAGVVELRLRPVVGYRKLIDRADGLYATVTVTFTASGHRTLTRTLPVDFRRPVGRGHARKSPRRNGSSR